MGHRERLGEVQRGNRFGEERCGGAAALRPYSAAASPERSGRAMREWTRPGAGGTPHTQHRAGGAENGTPGEVWRSSAGKYIRRRAGGGAAALRPYSAAASPERSGRAMREWTRPGAGGPPHTRHCDRWGGKRDTGHGSAGISGQVVLKTGHRTRLSGKRVRQGEIWRRGKQKWTDPRACPEQIYKSIWTIFQTQASPPSSSPPYWEMLSSGSVDSAEASAEDPATSSFSASSSPSSQRSRASASSVLSLIFTK